eukprot:TRINITY_DN15737_c0_g1_i2.p1 TRINITY_DN15737_c0_g1~~TRINITY_DN15737_c0_g1_i2.p1  ORF type:complete len:261 (+),score=50.21 TRINITY_DN15737_c0_g1_i2:100-882(+)
MSFGMTSLNRDQKDKVARLQDATGVPTKLAVEILKRYNWDLMVAADALMNEGLNSHRSFSGRGSSVPPCDAKKLDAFFRKYKCAEEDCIRPEGIQELCNDLVVSVLDPVTLVLSWHCQADQMGIFTRDEFSKGMQRLGCDDIQKLRAKLEDLRAQLGDRNTCKEVYAFTFQFALDQGQRCLPLETCVEFWKLLLPPHFALLDKWLEFVEAKVKNAISRDTWMMLYDLATQVKPDLSDYDVNGAWPVMLDEFVDYVRSTQA